MILSNVLTDYSQDDKVDFRVSRKRLLGSPKNNDIFDPKELKESLIGQFWPYYAWWCQISHTQMNFGLFFQKWSLGTQESFCKVSDQLDTRLNNYGIVSRHTSSIKMHMHIYRASTSPFLKGTYSWYLSLSQNMILMFKHIFWRSGNLTDTFSKLYL